VSIPGRGVALRVRTAVEDRLRDSLLGELNRLRRRVGELEEAAAENELLRPALERRLAELEESLGPGVRP
jgi:hypothetical protein